MIQVHYSDEEGRGGYMKTRRWPVAIAIALDAKKAGFKVWFA